MITSKISVLIFFYSDLFSHCHTTLTLQGAVATCGGGGVVEETFKIQ